MIDVDTVPLDDSVDESETVTEPDPVTDVPALKVYNDDGE